MQLESIHPIFRSLYEAKASEADAFAQYWCGPQVFQPHEKTLVALYPKYPNDGDGMDVRVYCTASPARHYYLHALPGEDGLGGELPGYQLSTSNPADFVAALALLTCRGLVAVVPSPRQSLWSRVKTWWQQRRSDHV